MEPLRYIESIRAEAEKAGICKIIPPEGWKPTFALDSEVLYSCSMAGAGSLELIQTNSWKEKVVAEQERYFNTLMLASTAL